MASSMTNYFDGNTMNVVRRLRLKNKPKNNNNFRE